MNDAADGSTPHNKPQNGAEGISEIVRGSVDIEVQTWADPNGAENVRGSVLTADIGVQTWAEGTSENVRGSVSTRGIEVQTWADLTPIDSQEHRCSHQEKSTLHILTIGQIGSGKSALINTLFQRDISPENALPTKETSSVIPTSEVVNDVTVKVYDTPGLLDPKQADEIVFKEVQESVKEFDLIFFCKKMTTRIDKGDVKLISSLPKLSKVSVWERTIFVLTFAHANEVTLPQRRTRSKDSDMALGVPLSAHYNELYHEMTKLLRESVVENANVPPETANAIPVIPVGYDTSKPLPDSQDEWQDRLWKEAFKRLECGTRPLLIKTKTDVEDSYVMVPDFK